MTKEEFEKEAEERARKLEEAEHFISEVLDDR